MSYFIFKFIIQISREFDTKARFDGSIQCRIMYVPFR
jgi:hypothetical protein